MKSMVRGHSSGISCPCHRELSDQFIDLTLDRFCRLRPVPVARVLDVIACLGDLTCQVCMGFIPGGFSSFPVLVAEYRKTRTVSLGTCVLADPSFANGCSSFWITSHFQIIRSESLQRLLPLGMRKTLSGAQ